ncbi:MAG: hypothetical protein ABI890_15720 [Lapillicoccus sp.]
MATASVRMPAVRALLDELAADLGPVPDLGPAVVMDQLAVLVHDAYATQPGLQDAQPGLEDALPRREDALEGRLADLRRAL